MKRPEVESIPIYLLCAIVIIMFFVVAHIGATICCALPSSKDELRQLAKGRERAREGGDRSSVALGLSEREQILDVFFLREPENRKTITLLMRGMPIPATYGFPRCEGGTLCQNWMSFVENFHPLISIFAVEPLHPFTARERFIVFLCTVALNFFLTAVYMRYRFSDLGFWAFTAIKYGITIIYAVLIRQLVICPCLYKPVMDAANTDSEGVEDGRPVDGSDDAGRRLGRQQPNLFQIRTREKNDALRKDAWKLVRWKFRGDKLLIALYVGHIGMVAMVLLYVCLHEKYSHRILERHTRQTNSENSPGATNPWAFMAWSVFVSESLNFVMWFVKFAPLFLLLFPIHRAQWHHGGSLTDYLLFRRPCAYWVVDSDKPKCVRPETTTLDRPSFLSIVRIFYSEDAHLSTLRHLHDGADLEALLNPDTAPPEDATPPDGDEASALLG